MSDPWLETDGSGPLIAAVVCTRNRVALLDRALEGLARQTLPKSSFEVVVVDDGSTDSTSDLANRWSTELPLQFARQRAAGLASAKNHGLYRSRAPLVLFLDDDDVADAELLERHVLAHRQHPRLADAVLGYTRLATRLDADPLMDFVTRAGGYLFSYGTFADGAKLDFSHFWGGRTSCKREFLLRHGVFHQAFTFGCEDIELGFRLSRHGLTVHYRADAFSTMLRELSLEDFCARLRRQGRSNALFSSLYADRVVQEWTRVSEARSGLAGLECRRGEIEAVASRLDVMARQKIAASLPLTEFDLRPLHRAYRDVFHLSLYSGIAEGLDALPRDDGARGMR
jgi:glycosyltransferase involved in cell wall biosynthesis